MTVPMIDLNDGNRIPQLGFGVFLVEPDETQRIVEQALEAGYRHIDTAAIYRNEEGVGRAIAASGLPREEIFVTTKLWNEDQGTDTPKRAIETSLKKLGLDYVDLYLIHWPTPQRNLYVESWQALERIADDGFARSIGVSNFHPEHLERIIAESDTVPAVNQVELHPVFQQRPLREVHARHGIATEAWAGLGQGRYDLFGMEPIQAAAKNHGVTPAQVAIRWHIQSGIIIFPKSSTPERIRENFDVFGFELTAEEMAAIDALDTNERLAADPNDFN